MYLTILTTFGYTPMVAPLGAAAYVVTETANKVTVFFAMMKKDETGLDALLRVRKDYGPDWQPVAARPNEQLNAGDGTGNIARFDMEFDNGVMKGATTAVQEFLEAVSRVSQLPVAPPKEMVISYTEWKRSTQLK